MLLALTLCGGWLNGFAADLRRTALSVLVFGGGRAERTKEVDVQVRRRVYLVRILRGLLLYYFHYLFLHYRLSSLVRILSNQLLYICS